ncbi:MAG: Ig-like domain-containing protein [Nanoarchaeota archaeon]|nr:Ig-like domain-containing protein [Nanoarchaeota archaeon]
MKKLLSLLIVLAICIGSVAATVTQTFNFNPAGETTLLWYDVYTDGNIVLNGDMTTSEASYPVLYETDLPAGIESYILYFLKEGYVPQFVESWYEGNGVADTENINFEKISNCQAPLEVSTYNVRNAEHPLTVWITANIDGNLYSPWVVDVTEDEPFIPKDEAFKDHFTAQTKLNIKAIKDGIVEFEASEEFDLWPGEQQTFEFPWVPEEDGEYQIIATTSLEDETQCSSWKPSLDIEELTVFREDELADSCFTNILTLTTEPLDPAANNEVIIKGTKTSNYLDLNAEPRPVPTELYLEIYDTSNNEVYNDWQIVPANSNGVDTEEFTFSWTPEIEGDYEITVYGVAESDMCLGKINAPNEKTITRFVGSEDRNPSPIMNSIPDQYAEQGIAPEWKVDLWEYTNDNTPDEELDFYIYQDNSDLIDCFIESNRYISCTASTGFGENQVTVYASDGETAGSAEFSVFVIEEGENQAPVVSDIPDITMHRNSIEKNIDLDNYVTDSDNDEITWTFSGNTNVGVYINDLNQITFTPNTDWHGEETVTFTATDSNGASDSDSMTVTVLDEEKDDEEETSEDFGNGLYISNLGLLNGDNYYPGEDIRLNVQIENKGNDLENVKITAIIPELNIRRSIGPFDLDHNDHEGRTMILEIPDYAEQGEYGVRFIIRDGGHNSFRIKYRTLEII